MRAIVICLSLFLASCSNLPNQISNTGTSTVADRAALHAFVIQQAEETLREARDWQQLNSAVQPVPAQVPTSSMENMSRAVVFQAPTATAATGTSAASASVNAGAVISAGQTISIPSSADGQLSTTYGTAMSVKP